MLFRLKLFTLHDPVEEWDKPRVVLVWPQGREPHLPVQPWLMREDKGKKRTRYVAWLVQKGILLPWTRRAAITLSNILETRVRGVKSYADNWYNQSKNWNSIEFFKANFVSKSNTIKNVKLIAKTDCEKTADKRKWQMSIKSESTGFTGVLGVNKNAKSQSGIAFK